MPCHGRIEPVRPQACPVIVRTDLRSIPARKGCAVPNHGTCLRVYASEGRPLVSKDAPPDQTSPDADPDGDRFKNALEYAFNLSPLQAETAGWPEGSLAAGPVPDAPYHAMKFRRRVGTDDLIYYVQASTNLTTWLGGPGDSPTTEVELRNLGDDMQEVTVRTLDPLATVPVHFMRLNVRLGP